MNEDLRKASETIKEYYAQNKMNIGVLEKIGYGKFFNYIFLSENRSGMAFNFTDEHAFYEEFEWQSFYQRIKPLLGRSAWEFLEMVLSSNGIQMRSLSLATLNALSQPLTEKTQLERRNIQRISKEIPIVTMDDRLTFVGYSGMVEQFQGKCKELHVTDLRSKHDLFGLLIGENMEYGQTMIEYHRPENAAKIIRSSDVVMITGSSIVNKSYLDILEQAQNARVIGMYGPSAQILPEILFEKGVNYITSARMTGDFQGNRLPMNAQEVKIFFNECMENYVITPASV